MRGAEELANDLHHALEVVESERDEAMRERDEAQAVIDAVRKVRERIARLETTYHRTWSETDDEPCRMWAVVTCEIGKMLDKVDGL